MGIGYEGYSIDDFVSRLRLRGVDTVVDVRLNPLSRKRGFSKTLLRETLEAAGIGYLHLPALGNPKDNRDGFASAPGQDGGARERFANLLSGAEAAADLETLVTLTETSSIALLCFEADEAHCHRSEVLAEVRKRRRALTLA